MIGWHNTIQLSGLILDSAVIAVLFGVAWILRSRVTVLQRYLIPTSLIAGFIGLVTGPTVLNILMFSTERMAVYVYHLLALIFIVVGLRAPRSKAGVNAFHVGFLKTVTFIAQALVGLGILLLFHLFVDDSISPAIGMLLPLGFGMGPGIALSVGESWEGLGIAGATDAGLAVATAGFLVAYVVGVWAVNRGVRDGLARVSELGEAENISTVSSNTDSGLASIPNELFNAGERADAPFGTTRSLAVIAVSTIIVYTITYVILVIASAGMQRIGMNPEVPVLWSLNFLWANLIAILFRRTVLARLSLALELSHPVVDKSVAIMADLLVAAAVMAIGLTLARVYVVPIALMCVAGATVTYFIIRRAAMWAFGDHQFARFVGLFGEQTGTVSSGLALIRIIDPGYKTSVAADQVLGSGTALVLGFPMLLLINLPLTRFGGSLVGYAVVATILTFYLALAVVGWREVRKRYPGKPGEGG